MTKSLSVIIPSLNEEKNVRSAVENAVEVLERYGNDYEILAFNDGSTDQTGPILEEFAKRNSRVKVIHNQPNKGYGFISREGIRIASRENLGWLSGDNSVKKESFAAMVQAMGEAEIIIGYMNNLRVRNPLRIFFTSFFTLLMNAIFGLRIKYYTGPCIYPAKLARSIKIKSQHYSLFAELFIRSVALGHTYKEVPFDHQAQNDKHSKAVSFKNITGFMKTIFVLVKEIYILKKPAG